VIVLLFVVMASAPLAGLYLVESGPPWISDVTKNEIYNGNTERWERNNDAVGTTAVIFATIILECALAVAICTCWGALTRTDNG